MVNVSPATIIEPIVVSDESTVVGLYEPTYESDGSYQSEAELEESFVKQLQGQGYERLQVHDINGLRDNLRARLEALNDYRFSDSEWERFYYQCIVAYPPGEPNPVIAKARRIQEDYVQVLTRDDGTKKNICLIDKDKIHRNSLQVIKQYTVSSGTRTNRYDVTILVNGLPLVHVELKRRGVKLREAFNQINRYHRESFHSEGGDGLFEYVQLFIISNGTQTKYYSNTTRLSHTKNSGKTRGGKVGSQSYEFTMWWTDRENNPITDLTDFTRTFLVKRTLLSILTRYCVLTVDNQLLVMRPYQIAATEAILLRIKRASLNKETGTVKAGGYIWHTTGSGKTLTSFKTAKLVADIKGIDKVIFVVDRKDLDHQTIKTYNQYAVGTVSANHSTKQLAAQIADPGARIIVTTIQKLSNFVKANRGHEIYDGHIVFIFDECHRSQFGDMHAAITKAFRNYHLFGFTGTPIFAQNARSSGKARLRTTEQAFGDQLHSYTIVDAIRDENVLPFRVEYNDTFRTREDIENYKVEGIDTDSVYIDPRRIKAVVSHILKHFSQKTKRNSTYLLEDQRVQGFNSLFATFSIKAARAYYAEFERQQQDLPPEERLKIATIYSYSPNSEDPDTGLLCEESMDTKALSADDRDFLDRVIAQYNKEFGTNFGTDPARFENYYEHLSKALATKAVDLVIVVDMFLTGFDSKTLNTLWVDKNLRAHGLIQAFSRTNRILNSVKTYGNIVCFRNLEEEVEEAIALFGNKNARGQILLRPYNEYLSEYIETVKQLREQFPLPIGIIASEAQQKNFISLMGKILRLCNILTAYDDFETDDIMSPRELEDYRSIYLDLYQDIRTKLGGEKEPIVDDLEFEIELVKQVDINVDYILMLVEQHRVENEGGDREIPVEISRALAASPSLRGKRDLIEEFYRRVSAHGDVTREFKDFIDERRDQELTEIIERYRLKSGAREFAFGCLRDNYVPSEGAGLADILPPARRFGGGGASVATRENVVNELTKWVERFRNLGEVGLSQE